MAESQTDCGNQDSSVRNVHHQYTPVWQRGMDNICQARSGAEQLPHAQSTQQPRHYMERQSANAQVLERAGLPTMYTLLRRRRLCWLCHVRRMEDGRIPKDILYGELASGKRSVGYSQLRYKDVCKRDLKGMDISTQSWEDMAADRTSWRSTLQRQLKAGEE